MLLSSDSLDDLEKIELQNPDGNTCCKLYCKLLASYLLQNELCSAKYLWRRIPEHMKNSSTDLENIWKVGKKMWQRDWSGVHSALSVPWNEDIEDIMKSLKDRTRERAYVLISDAYSSLEVSTLAKMTGLTLEEAQEVAIEKEWDLSGSIVKPRKVCKQHPLAQETIAEDQLHKLTQFVSFLEN